MGPVAHCAAADPAGRLTALPVAEHVLYASFIVRLWREPTAADAAAQEPAWMGELESIQTGRAWRFQGLEPLLELLAGQLAANALTFYHPEERS